MEVTQAELSSDIYNKTFDLEELKQIVAPIAEKYGLEAVYLFGSQARGDAKPDSDYDFFVKRDKLRTLFQLGGLFSDLQEALHKEVDIVLEPVGKKKLDAYLVEGIYKDGILIYKKHVPFSASQTCQVRSSIRTITELPYQTMAAIFKNEIPYNEKEHKLYFLGFFEECWLELIKRFMAEQGISRQQIIDLFYKLPQCRGEIYHFREALKNGKF